ncbi:hypothetical protein F0229_13400 [Vibrio sp. AIC-3]|uniref:hypothetical protein n=1 Tax=Vibrio sp. AIC-3 TaxID=2607604 RepID=UPI0014939B2A|nr:hypothetical protein [Vibrio sp. AIC-3]NOH93554.1 hypothetical protein [Vibrio sp. AIC-3]
MNHLYDAQPEREIPNTLSPQDVGFIAGVTQDVTKTNQNIAAIDSGFFSAIDNSWLETEQRKLKEYEQFHFVATNKSAKLGREAQGEALKGIGLSKGAKVRQGKSRKQIDRLITRSRKCQPRHKTQSTCAENHDAMYNQAQNANQKGKSRAYLMHRPWSEQVKMQMIYQPRPSDAPSANDGERYTDKLTSRAVRQIFESGAYVAACHGGFKTFLTLTFDEVQRDRIFSGEITLGSEVSRFLDGAKKLFQRGFTATLRSNRDNHSQRNIDECEQVEIIEGSTAPFHYIWVAECPMNEDGEPNPHVHILLDWSVERSVFDTWAQRLESIWGHGFANLQRIKLPKAAGSYLIKAVGYAAKGGNANQGLIRGNRYNIARCSRAPKWEVLAAFDADNMAAIIKECGYRLERWRKPLEKEVRRKQFKRDEAIRASAIAKDKTPQKFKLQRLIKMLDGEIRDYKEQIKSRGVFARTDNTFSICFEGGTASEKMDEFLLWAHGARDWSMNTNDVELGDLRAIAIMKYNDEYERFLCSRANWQSQLHQELPPQHDDLEALKSHHLELVESYYINKTHD